MNTLKLWNPKVAVSLSLLFSPVFGAWIQAKNWQTLGQYERAKRSMIWVYVSLIMLLLAANLHFGGLLGLILILAWFVFSANQQIRYIDEQSIQYEKKSWLKPILFALLGLILYGLISAILIQLTHPELLDEWNQIIEPLDK